mgnify:CR=1 FL=1
MENKTNLMFHEKNPLHISNNFSAICLKFDKAEIQKISIINKLMNHKANKMLILMYPQSNLSKKETHIHLKSSHIALLD